MRGQRGKGCDSPRDVSREFPEEILAKAANPEPDPGIWGTTSVVFLDLFASDKPNLRDLWLFCTRGLVRWARAHFSGGLELLCHPWVPGSAPQWLFPGTQECFWLPHTFPGTHATIPGCSRGRGMCHRWVWGWRATVASLEPAGAAVDRVLGSCLVQSPCTTGTVVSPPVTRCSQARQGVGSDLKKENFPIHTQPDTRDAWRRTSKTMGTLAQRGDKAAHGDRFAVSPGHSRSCPATPALGPCLGSINLLARPGWCRWHLPSLPLRQVWGSGCRLCQECAECVGA